MMFYVKSNYRNIFDILFGKLPYTMHSTRYVIYSIPIKKCFFDK